jgi:hypothetical protein
MVRVKWLSQDELDRMLSEPAAAYERDERTAQSR